MERTNPFVAIYKKGNTGNMKEKWERLTSDDAPPAPLYMDVELTNQCNFHCLMCPTGTGESQRARGFMSDSTWKRVLEDIEKYKIAGVRLIGWGEPTLHPHFMDWLHQLQSTGTLVHFNTNGSLLTTEQLYQIVEWQIPSMKFSFQGVDEKTYGEMRDGGDFRKLMQTVEALYRIRGERPYPFIQISTTVTYETKEQIREFEEKIAPYCDFYNVGRTKMSHLDEDKMTISEEKKKTYRKLKEAESNAKCLTTYCSEVFDKLTIGWDGLVSLCCTDTEYRLRVGDINKTDLSEIYLCTKANSIRGLLADGKFREIMPCKNCYGFMTLTT